MRSRPSWRDGGHLAAISLKFRISQTSWQDLYNLGDLGNLGEMKDILPQSRQDLESHKHHGEISAILVRSCQFWRESQRDLSKNFAQDK